MLRITRLFPSLFGALLALLLMHGFLIRANSAQASRALAAAPALSVAEGSVSRDFEPIIVTGLFSGALVNEIFVYRAVGGVWEQITFQVDELTASGSYTLTEDGRLDANDEIVFMAGDLGDKATTSITASLPISLPWYQIEVTDPLSPAQQGWAYVVRSSQLTPNTTTDYADYITATQRVSATHYSVGWATSHAGLDYMTLFDSADILDRTKLRAVGHFLGFPVLITEENPLLLAEIALIRDGLVRVIVRQGTATTLAYASTVETLTPIALPPPPTVTVMAARVSTDLNGNAAGGTFYNENTPLGVTIDGITDTIPITTPLVNAWRQISLDNGTIIQVIDMGSPGGMLYHYYKDNNTFDSEDTGDGMSYGDAGILVVSPTTTVVTLESVQYILPGRQINRGAEFYEFFHNPLLVSLQAEGEKTVYLPLITK